MLTNKKIEEIELFLIIPVLKVPSVADGMIRELLNALKELKNEHTMTLAMLDAASFAARRSREEEEE